MKKILCILLSLCLLSLVSAAVTAQSCGVAAPCPDRDGDGVQDAVDRCVSDVGPASNAGCPESTTGQPSGNGDTDGDGVADSNDQCTTVAGSADFGGCPGPSSTPVPDSDADGENDSVDLCLGEPGPAENKGCPVGTVPGGSTTGPTATPAPSTDQPNPLVPPTSGPCQLTTVSTLGANVRAEPSLNAAVVGSLDPNQLYAVLSAIVNAEGTWYRIEGGWVSSVVGNIGGQCPARIIAAGPSGFSIAQADYEQVRGGIFPDSHCFDLFNGMKYCHTILRATADDGSTEGWAPGGTNICGIGIGGLDCTLIEFNSWTPDGCDIECLLEPPHDFPPTPPPPGPGAHGAVYCKTLLDKLALPTEGPDSPYYTIYHPDGGIEFGVKLPPLDPQPCVFDVYVVREDGAANGQIPVDRLQLEIKFPPAVGVIYMPYSGIDGASEDRPEPGIKLLNVARLDLDGNVCITATHGDFTWCPGVPPTAPDDRTDLPTPVWPDPILDSLMSFPGGGDPTGSYTCDMKNGIGFCVCTNSAACLKMAAFCGDATTTCYGNVCGCGSPVGPVDGD